MTVVRRWVPYLFVLLLLAAAAFVAGNAAAGRATASAQAPDDLAPDDLAAPAGGARCTIIELAQLSNRIHVKCQPNTGGIGSTLIFFSAPTGSAAEVREANRYMSLLMLAWAFGKQPFLWWEDSPNLNPAGCLTSDCRRLTAVVFQQ